MATISELEKQIEALKEALAAASKNASVPREKKFVNGGKFWALTSRYVNGQFVVADPEHPAMVVFNKKHKIEVDAQGNPMDGTLRAYTEAAPVEKAVKPFAEIRRGPPDRKASDGDRAPGARPSDEDPAE